jgi:endonuclease YncB( thermonuclease family)
MNYTLWEENTEELGSFIDRRTQMEYEVQQLRVIDGDTVEALIYEPVADCYLHRAIRLYGVDTPEKNTLAGRLVKLYVQQWIEKHSKGLEFVYVSKDKFSGRIVGSLENTVESLQHSLFSKNLAREYYGGTKKPWTLGELSRICQTLQNLQADPPTVQALAVDLTLPWIVCKEFPSLSSHDI